MNTPRRPWIQWLLLALLVLAIALGLARALNKRAAQRDAANQAAEALQQAPVYELTAQDVVVVQPLTLAQTGAGRFAGARTLIHLQAQALLAMREPARAAAFLQEQIALYQTDARLWRLLAQAHAALDQPALAHRATAEEYALSGSWLAAVEQLRLALKLGTLDFYTGSLADARMKTFQAEYQREKQEKVR